MNPRIALALLSSFAGLAAALAAEKPNSNPSGAAQSDAALRQQATQGLRRAVEFFRKEVAVEGTYLWQYSEDLKLREGEGVASASRGWVQPPGTPSVGSAFLTAYDATADAYYLEAARETAQGLVRGQLQSGGWTYFVEFDPAERRKVAFRDNPKPGGRNVTTLDDDTTQSAVRFLMHADRALGFKDVKIHESVQYALECLLKAQYPNGAWPQGYDRFPSPDQFPVRKANFPDSWPREWPGSGQYWQRYTLNDNSLATTIETMFEAGRVYGRTAPGNDLTGLAARCRDAAEKAGDFLLLAQMPEPQPAWAQQYSFDMQPAWARKFEPPSITAGESQGVLRSLLGLYLETGHRKYLEPVPRALAYLRRSRLSDGRLARFYSLRENKPLYFTKEYQLTDDDGDMPTHYAFKVSDGTEAIAREYERLAALLASDLESLRRIRAAKPDPRSAAEVQDVLAAQDARGRWTEGGGLRYQPSRDPSVRVIRSATFSRNIEILSRYLAAARSR